MDVLRPQLLYIHGRCYRINNPDSEYYETKSGVEWDDNPSNYGNQCTLEEPCDGEDDENEYDIQQTESGRFKTVFHIARPFYGIVIGKKGQTKKRLEDETKTIIRVPRLPTEKDIIISGSSKRAVTTARRRIEYMVMSGRKNQSFTHFLSIPMTSPSVKERFMQFKEQVLQSSSNTRGVDGTIFQNPDKLHLTICTMVLLDDTERSTAAKILEQCKLDVIDPLMEGNSITILLAGVEYMNDDPTEVDVLYAKVHSNEILQVLVDRIVNYCSSKGLIDKQYDQVKLHVTIMNTLFRDSKSDDPTKPRQRETFNAGPILQAFQDFEFGEIDIDNIHLSTRHTTSKSDGYYQSSMRMSLYI